MRSLTSFWNCAIRRRLGRQLSLAVGSVALTCLIADRVTVLADGPPSEQSIQTLASSPGAPAVAIESANAD